MNNHIQVTLKSSTIEMNLNSPEESIYLVPELEGLTTLPEIRTSSGVNAGADGGWTSAQLFDARLISMRLVIANEDIAVVESRRRLLNTLLAQGRNEELTLNITTEAGNAYTVNVRVTSVSASLDRVLHKQDFLIQFRADDPLIYGSTEGGGVEAILNVQKALGGFAIPFTFPLAIGGGADGTVVQNVGTETVYPIITLYGNLHSPTVINRTTNQQLQIIADLASDIIWGQSQTAQGEYIQVTNELDIPAKLASVEMLGKAEQAGTPTPASPRPISVVTGENTVKIEGKNLLNLAEFVKGRTDSGIVGYASGTTDLTIIGDSISFTTNANYRGIVSGMVKVEPNTAYTFTADADTAIVSRYIDAYDKNGNWLQRITGTFGISFTATTPANCYGLRVSFQITTPSSATLSNLMLVKGSTVTDYEPYHGQEFEVNLGKNLSSISGYTDVDWGTSKPDFLPVLNSLSAGTYTISMTFTLTTRNDTTDASVYGIYFSNTGGGTILDRNGEWESKGVGDSVVFTRTFTLSSANAGKFNQAYFYGCGINGVGGTGKATVSEIQIEKGSTATTYASYFTPIELAGVGEIQPDGLPKYHDSFKKTNGKWYIEKKVGKVVLDGSENWASSGQPNGFVCAYSQSSPFYGKLALGDPSYQSMCDHFEFQPNGTTWTGLGKCGFNSAGAFWLQNTQSGGIIAWLSTHPTTVYYALATPTTTEITNEALIAQLDALESASLYLGLNNIGTETQNAMPTLKIEYHTSYEKQTDVVVIDSQANTITLNGLDIYNLMTEGSEFIEIAPGDNIMLLTSTQTSDDGYAEVKYKQGYLSI